MGLCSQVVNCKTINPNALDRMTIAFLRSLRNCWDYITSIIGSENFPKIGYAPLLRL